MRPSIQQSILVLSLIVLIVIAIQSSQSPALKNQPSLSSLSTQNVAVMDQKRSMVGAYSTVDPKQTQEMIPIAQFALMEFASSKQSASESSFTVLPSQIESKEITPVILAAERQVVAGMNYKLTIGLMQKNVCVGGFKVTVWKQLGGELKATNWGDVLTCQDIESEFGEVLNALRVENKMEGETVEAEPNA